MNNKQESNLDNLNRDKRDKFLNNLEMAKNLLTVAGDIATSVSPLKNISSAKGLILMQSTAGGVIVDTAKGDTWDEQIVGIVGDFVGQVFLYATLKGSATPLNSALTLSGNHLGSHLKNALSYMTKKIPILILIKKIFRLWSEGSCKRCLMQKYL